MFGYKEIDIEVLHKLKLVVYGCGKFGSRCINILHKNHIEVFEVTDQNSAKIGKVFYDHPLIPIEQFKEDYQGKTIIVAIEDFEEPIQVLKSWGFENILLFFKNTFWRIEIVKVFNEYNGNILVEKLKKEKIVVLFDNEKIMKDLEYIFDWVHFENVAGATIENITLLVEEGFHIVLGENYKEEIDKKIQEQGIDRKYYAFIDEFLTILNDRNRIKGKIPSIMAEKTIFGSSYDQNLCRRPFNEIHLSSNFSVHCCCGDWSDSWGNLEYNTIQEIWNSDIAKIFRCSILNRTYSFCNWFNCVHMKVEADKIHSRIEPPYLTDSIPRLIEIGIDKTCNLFCGSCRNSVCIESGEKKRKNEIIAQQLLDSGWLSKTQTVLLGGQGEVFFSPVYEKLMYGTDGNRKTLDLRTNGTLFTQEKLTGLLQKYDRLKVIVSIDAARKETYDRLRRSNSPYTWDKLSCNLEMLSKARHEGKLLFFQINMCVQMLNYEEIPDFIKWGERLGVDKVYFTPIRNWGTYEKEEFSDISIFLKGKQLKKEVQKLVDIYRSKTIVKFEF